MHHIKYDAINILMMSLNCSYNPELRLPSIFARWTALNESSEFCDICKWLLYLTFKNANNGLLLKALVHMLLLQNLLDPNAFIKLGYTHN